MPLRQINPFADPTLRALKDCNPYLTALRDGQNRQELPLFFADSLRGRKGIWRETLASYHEESQAATKPLIVEIGCYKGKTLIEFAEHTPEQNFIGVDITFKRVVKTAERIRKRSLRNAACIMANLNPTSLKLIFGPGEIDGWLIFFPDPWTKPKHANNRLMSQEFCRELATHTRRSGFVWFKTDQKAYFDEANRNLEAAGFSWLEDGLEDFSPELRSIRTPFEETFNKQDQEHFSSFWRLAGKEI